MTFGYNLAQFIPFRDAAACGRVRAIKKEDISRHANPEFRIRVIEDPAEFYLQFALDIVLRLKESLEAGTNLVAIFPVGPMPQYEIAAAMINNFRISCRHLISFNMDEYADQDGNTAPKHWEGSFQRAMVENFFSRLAPELRPPDRQIHFPTREKI